ncbi:hypothetical protein MACJ_002077 [Theileria orientalis]|uniref:General transcription factor IIH subunit n=1 Tax=Theileria orientalis TaxID=68886 RepID=A0A976QQB6_THEOR|nr:hypothetical protein MACJ_002077 [Theileria orientalis]
MSFQNKANKYLLEELLNEFEQSLDIKNENDDEAYQQYAWEQDFDKSWEQLVDKDGELQFIKPQSRIYSEPEADNETPFESLDVISKRGIIRNVVILFDMSETMLEKDFKPDRLYCSFGALKEFVKDLFSKGPITQLGMVVMRNKVANLICQLGTNPEEQLELLGNSLKEGAEGPSSLQNGLEMCLNILCDLPSYSTREVLVIFGSNRTLDAGNILVTLEKLKQNNLTINSISLSPELYILKNICLETGGNYSVARDANHLKHLLNNYTSPPPWKKWMEPVLLKVAFPPLKKTATVSLCVCHSSLVNRAYICPQCHSKSCYIPTKCKCCGIYLVSPPDISRAFHHLIPPKTFIKGNTHVTCSSCNLRNNTGFRCPSCDSWFCEYCNVYIKEELHQCPMCLFLKVNVKQP